MCQTGEWSSDSTNGGRLLEWTLMEERIQTAAVSDRRLFLFLQEHEDVRTSLGSGKREERRQNVRLLVKEASRDKYSPDS